jgi:hypothetical protein
MKDRGVRGRLVPGRRTAELIEEGEYWHFRGPIFW